MDDYMPQLIRIMPDYGGEYVFDEDGGVTRFMYRIFSSNQLK